MKFEYLQGFNDALTGKYLNPYSPENQANQFMQYHNGHNSGSWHKRTLINISILTP